MKTTMKTKLAIGTFAVALGMASILPSVSYAMRVEALDDTWGQAAKVEKNGSTSEIRYYKQESTAYPGTFESDSYRVFEVLKDGKVIDKGFSKEAHG